jgi:tetratricopeptide (TPR) repeat protein
VHDIKHGKSILVLFFILVLGTSIVSAQGSGWDQQCFDLAAQGRYQEALNACNQALAANPNSVSAWENKGASLLALNRNQDALDAYEKALALDSTDTYAWFGKGRTLSQLGRYQEALSAFEKALALDSDFKPAWDGKGISLWKLGRYQEALLSFERALALDPNDTYAWNGKGTALDDLGRYQEALLSFERALALDPSYADAWNGKGIALYHLGRYQEAFAAYNRALALDPNNAQVKTNRDDLVTEHPEVLTSGTPSGSRPVAKSPSSNSDSLTPLVIVGLLFVIIAVIYAAAKNRERVRSILSTGPDRISRKLQTASSLLGAGNTEKARQVYEEIIREIESSPSPSPVEREGLGHAYHHLGLIDLNKNREEAAFASFRKAKACNVPLSEGAVITLAEGFAREQDRTEAVGFYLQYITLRPEINEKGRPVYTLLESICSVAEDTPASQMDVTIPLNLEVTTANPKLEWAWNNLGLAYFLKGDYPNAIYYYERGLQLNATQPKAHFYIGQAFMKRGSPDDALSHFRSAVLFAPEHAGASFMIGKILIDQLEGG